MTTGTPRPLVSRRGFALGTVAALVACRSRRAASTESSGAGAISSLPSGTPGSTRLVELRFPGEVSTRAVAVVPTWGGQTARFPVVVALHGRGEARKEPSEGALGWPRDYALVHAVERVCAPPLTPVDFEGFVGSARLATFNRTLADRPFGGLIVACPYLPDLDLKDASAVSAFGHFVTDVLLPRVRRDTPALSDPASTGIDGVSLGGAVALAVGLDAAASFGAVGCMQAALDPRDAPRWAERARAARAARRGIPLRLLTSDGDYFRDALRTVSGALRAGGVPHDFEEVLGPHDYAFNRGPGSIELLLWHDRELKRAV